MALAMRQLADDWQALHGYRRVLFKFSLATSDSMQ